MRVLMLAQFYAPIVGGEERMTQSLAGELAQRGHDVAVATLRQPGLAAFEQIDGIGVPSEPAGFSLTTGAATRPRRPTPKQCSHCGG
jgi:NAD(P)-dependent dehydrogenase (short-subunit alcohol dehydrogenase family)